MKNRLVVVRGGGDIASGTIHRLVRCGYQVVVLETDMPTVIRRTVAYASAVFQGEIEIEGIKAIKADDIAACKPILEQGHVPVLVDKKASSIKALQPIAVVDAILAKKNLGTCMDMAPIVIGLGPGFCAGKDVHAVIETNRGHYLGSVINKGSAMENTGVPGTIAGYSWERVIRAPRDGIFHSEAQIGDQVLAGQQLGHVDNEPVLAPLDGVLRGLLADNITVTTGFKIGDVDPRGDVDHCYTISDKARAVAGGVLEAIMNLTYV